MKKTNKNSLGIIAILSLVIAAVCSLTACSDDLDVQQSYPFTVEVMPYADKIAKGQTVELRFEIKPEGNYANTLYTIRYFQYDGEGSLKLVDGPVLVNNDRVLLESKTFRLNYTAKSADSHKFLVVVEDLCNGQHTSSNVAMTFMFNSASNDE
ncbi:DUF3872 domain-containing protein [Muribaculum intestinale]|uniref:DUF3872 domain-containing protein n=1 Tax=Muribaculum intestinale TaxID=1796646 RepID=UPI0026EF77CA|nr:DUF3872 domain-containing protein [Muribaculum intestinale]